MVTVMACTYQVNSTMICFVGSQMAGAIRQRHHP